VDGVKSSPSHLTREWRVRIAASMLLSAMAIGCLALWLVVPALTLWALSQLVSSVSGFLFLSLAFVPGAMAGFAWLLGLANRRYLAVSGALHRLEEDGELDDDEPRRLHGPLESMLPPSIALAAVALVLWIVFFASQPSLALE
jgi:hypothetical protein